MSKPMIGALPPPVGKRPICPGCGDERKPLIYGVKDPTRPDDTLGSGYSNAREWTGKYHGYGYFCTLTCATAYANAIVRNMPTVVRRKYDV